MSPNLVAYVGLTHLGLISAAAALEKGFSVLCFDADASFVAKLKAGNYPINEPGFTEALEKNKENLKFTASLEDLRHASLVYIAPDIPTDAEGVSSLEGIKEVIESTIPFLSKDACLIVLSQVPPGFTRSLERENLDFRKVYYQVETLVFGIAMQRALYPERFIVGALNPKTPLEPKYRAFLEAFNCPLLVMDYESAEFCKICINAFLAATVSTANTLEGICQAIGAKWRDIVPALRLDKRIGEYAYLMPGLGLSGGNIERDLMTILSLSQKKGVDGCVVEGFVQNSHYRRNWPLRVFYRQILPQAQEKQLTLSVLGLAYKENTHSIKNSAALKLLMQLKNFNIQAYDPVVKILPLELASVMLKSSAIDAVKNADVLFLMTPWEEFKKLSPEELVLFMRGKIIVDPYNVLNFARDVALIEDVTYYSLC